MSVDEKQHVEEYDENQTGDQGGKEYAPPASQADLDRIIESRLARERAKFGDYDDLKAKISEYEEWKESQLTEQEKAVQAAREEGVQEATTSFERKLVSAEVKIQAQALGFHDPADALTKFGDDLPMKDGEPDVDAIKEVLTELADEKPYLLKTVERHAPKGKPKPLAGRKQSTQDGKGRAAAALRQLGAQRHR